LETPGEKKAPVVGGLGPSVVRTPLGVEKNTLTGFKACQMGGFDKAHPKAREDVRFRPKKGDQKEEREVLNFVPRRAGGKGPKHSGTPQGGKTVKRQKK